MGNTIPIEKKRHIFDILIKEYENLKSQNIDKECIFMSIIDKYNEATNVEVPKLDFDDIDIQYGDGVIKTDTFTLIGWNEDKTGDIDIEELENIIKRNAEKDIN